MALKELERKRFKDIFKNKEEFKTKITDELLTLFTDRDLPTFLNESKTYYTFNLIYKVLYNRWAKFYTIDEEEAFLRHLQNALLQTLPTLHLRTLNVKNDILDKLDGEGILTTTITNNQQDPENNNLRTTNIISETPETKGTAFTEDTKVTEKNLSITTDKRINVQTTEDRVTALKSLQEVQLSGEILNFVNCREISSLFLNQTDITNANHVYKFIGDSGPQGIRGIQGLKGDKGDKGDKGEKGEPGTGGGTGTGTVDLGDYYNKQEIDAKITTLAQQALSFTTNFLTTVEINRDFLNKSVVDIQEVKATIAAPKFINNSTELPTANSNELATTEYVDKGKFKKEEYFTRNAELLTKNDETSSEYAYIGLFYKGEQEYGFNAHGNVGLGNFSLNGIEIGKSNTGGIIRIGYEGDASIRIGSSKWGSIGGTSVNGNGILESGNISTTFKAIINKTNEKIDNFVANVKTGGQIGTINETTSIFNNGGSISAGNAVKVKFINNNFDFLDSSISQFKLINSNTFKLDVGELERVFLKIGVKVKTISAGSIGQLEIALKSGNIDLGVENIVVLNPNPNAFFVKTFGIYNSDAVKAEGVSVILKSQTATFEITGFQIVQL